MSSQSLNIRRLAAIALLLEEEEEEEKVRGKRKRLWVHQSLKKRKSEGEYWTLYKELADDEVKFYQYFRMSKAKYSYLLQRIEMDLTKMNTNCREAIPPKERLAVCLRYLATGDNFRTIAISYRLGHSTVHSIVKEVCKAIIKRLRGELMPSPTEETWRQIAADFWEVWNFPNCVGVIDGKHVKTRAPPNSGSLVFNYKQTFSIVLLGVVDANYRFVAVDIGSYGKNRDGGIFSNSRLGERLEKNTLNIPPETMLPGTCNVAPYVLVGDEAFPLKTYLMRPYPSTQINDDEKRVYNYRLSRARKVVENAFGILSQKFLIYQRTLNLDPENADTIVMATCLLHNFIRDENFSDFKGNKSTHSQTNLINIPRQGGNAHQAAFNVREKFKAFFSSADGALPWE